MLWRFDVPPTRQCQCRFVAVMGSASETFSHTKVYIHTRLTSEGYVKEKEEFLLIVDQ